MKKTRKINWKGILNLIICITPFVLVLLELENLTACYTTHNYQVWICDTSLKLFITIISIVVWSVWFLYQLIDLFCLEWEIKK